MKSTLNAPLNEAEIARIVELCLNAGLGRPESALEAYAWAERLIEHGFAIRSALHEAWNAAERRKRLAMREPEGAAILKELGL